MLNPEKTDLGQILGRVKDVIFRQTKRYGRGEGDAFPVHL